MRLKIWDEYISGYFAAWISNNDLKILYSWCIYFQPNDHKIIFAVKNMGTAKAYLFKVFAHNPVAATSSEVFRYSMPENVKRRAITAGLIGGVLFFIVAIIVSVCTVKICNRRKRRKQEQGMIYITMSLTRAYKYNTVGDNLGALLEKLQILLSFVLDRS